jgi:hypothetical protein
LTPQLYLDMDGVLADFDKRAFQIFGMPPSVFEDRFGSKVFWEVLQSSPDFYNSFDLMLDAPFLIDATRHLRPIVLTGVPRGDWAQGQKREWLGRMVPGAQVITCRSKDKALYCKPGDVLVDDRIEYKHLWEAAGGTYVVHVSAYESIATLDRLGVLRKPPPRPRMAA